MISSWKKKLKVDRVLHLKTSDETVLSRVRKRVEEAREAHRPERTDENAVTVLHRLKVQYKDVIEPLLNYYKNKGVLLQIDNEAEESAVHKSILSKLGNDQN